VLLKVPSRAPQGADSKAPPQAQPRAAEEIGKIQKIVMGAVGFSEQRGDQVTVVEMPFEAAPHERELPAAPEAAPPPASPLSMPVLAGLMQRGASSLSAQTILPSATLMAHASIISASCLAKHAITWNDYRPELGETHAVTLFDLVHAAGGRTVMVVGKEKLIQIVHRGTADVFAYVAGHDRDVAARAASEMAQGFEAMLVHLPVVDGVGHTFGWMSPQQVSVIERADTAVGALLEGLEANGLSRSTLIILTADHGGHGLIHGSDAPEDTTVPWIMAGPGVVPGLRLVSPISVMDTAATAAWALGLPRPGEWDGRAVEEAFGIPVDIGSIPVTNTMCAP